MKTCRLESALVCLLLVHAVGPALRGQTNVFPSSGNVGIGTTSPGAKLQIESGSEVIRNNSAGNRLIWQRTDDTQITGFGSDGYSDLTFITNNTEKFRVTSGGNVGIGTSTPDGKLHISGAPNTWTANGWCKGLRLDGIHAVEFGGGSGTRYGIGQSDNALYFFDTTVEDNSAPANYRMVLRNGNLGIGTTSPAGRLHLAGDDVMVLLQDTDTSGHTYSIASRWGGYLTIYDEAAPGQARLSINSSGNVGIGTTSPIARLQSSGAAQVLAPTLGSSAGGALLLTNTDANYGLLAGVSPTGNVWQQVQRVDGTGPVYNLLLQPAGGNVGIGTINPTQKLSVNGTVRAKEVIVDTGWSDYVFKPDYRLASLSEVEGAIKKDGHLPGIPSAKEVAERGISVGEMQAKLLAKIEELTLHVIEQDKELKRLKQQNEELLSRLKP